MQASFSPVSGAAHVGQGVRMSRDPYEPKIYWLPNLMTAGNLCCGFFAVLTIFKGIFEASAGDTYDFLTAKAYYERAILLIFASCLFDLLDGRLARLGGRESEFGREFDSLADIISFGMAPAMLMAKAVLFPLDQLFEGLGWVLAFIYVLCGALRLARFNCLAIRAIDREVKDETLNEFRGIPIPMAAGFIASLTFLIIDIYENDRALGPWIYVLAGAMLAISMLMISDVRYPSFKRVGWRTRGTLGAVVLATVILVLTVRYYQVMPVVLFSSYLVYGLVRPLISKRWRHNLESVIDDEDLGEEPEEEGLIH
jgi:CDP-diacylglycerol--serine O-phosphatidyltransferase